MDLAIYIHSPKSILIYKALASILIQHHKAVAPEIVLAEYLPERADVQGVLKRIVSSLINLYDPTKELKSSEIIRTIYTEVKRKAMLRRSRHPITIQDKVMRDSKNWIGINLREGWYYQDNVMYSASCIPSISIGNGLQVKH